MFLTIHEILEALSIAPSGENFQLTGVSTDSRSLSEGMVFVALRGENFDGHDYVETALNRGAAAIVVEGPQSEFVGRTISVPNTLVAYGRIARVWRGKFSIPVVAVTGSVGKTTVKEMLALTLSPLGPVLKSEKNENNEIGVPQSLLRLNEKHRAAVIEMGMRGMGQIAYLANIAEPNIGIVTMIGESHIELLGSREAIADAKGELVDFLNADGISVLNADDPFFRHLAAKTSGTIASFGDSANVDVQVTRQTRIIDGWNIVFRIDGEEHAVTLNSVAEHDVNNAAGAVAVAVAAGVSAKYAVAALAHYAPSDMRMELLTTASGATIISDCYNAAPTSVKSALSTLAGLESTGRKSAFLGDMRELGPHSAQMHQEVAAEAERLGIKVIYSVGDLMPAAIVNSAASFSDSTLAAEYIKENFSLSQGDVVLVKGSRALHLEKVVEALVQL